MTTQEIKDYWAGAMALSSKSVFANLERYLTESGDEGLPLLNENYNRLAPVIDVQKLTLAMQAKRSVIENKKYFLRLATKEMVKAKQILQSKFDQTLRLLVQLGFDVEGWTADNFFDKLAETESEKYEKVKMVTEALEESQEPQTEALEESNIKAKKPRKKKEEPDNTATETIAE